MSLVTQFLLVGLGGFLGSVSRFAVGIWMQRTWPAATLPVGTLAVNVLGCLLIGMLAAWKQPLEPGYRLFLMVGLFGGFTTFSAFALETLTLAQSDQQLAALTNVAVQVLASLAAVWVGFNIGKLLSV